MHASTNTILSTLVLGLLAGACSESSDPSDAGATDSSLDSTAIDSAVTDSNIVTDAGRDTYTDFDGGPGACGPDYRLNSLVYFGTTAPSELPLSDGQQLAVVDFGSCSGAFITDEWVLTASHCTLQVGARFCVGPNPLSADVCFTADRVENNPGADMTLVHADAPASSRIAELEPIPVMTEQIDETWLGRMTEAAGYGTQEDGSSNEREFTAEPIVALRGTEVTVDGMGTRGLCFGDSGGPLMVLASDATVRVLGDLSNGDGSCVGQDNFTRTDLQIEWIESIIGPVVVDGAPCGRITARGDCAGTAAAIWCDDATDMLTSEMCAAGTACGWDGSISAYRCVAEDPCTGISASGRCEEGVARWCDQGIIRSQDCNACDQLCGYVSEVRGSYCRPDPCVGMDPMGTCDGDILTTCDSVTGVATQDCSERGRTCGFSMRRNANRCIRP